MLFTGLAAMDATLLATAVGLNAPSRVVVVNRPPSPRDRGGAAGFWKVRDPRADAREG
jgi:hypothetical protein